MVKTITTVCIDSEVKEEAKKNLKKTRIPSLSYLYEKSLRDFNDKVRREEKESEFTKKENRKDEG